MSYPSLTTLRVKRVLTDFDIQDQIGEGNFSTIFKCRNKIDDQMYAVKQFEKAKVKRMRKENDVLMEKHSLNRLNHRNIPKIYDTWSDQVGIYIVTELCDVDLWDLTYKVGLPEDVARLYYIPQLITALEYCHRSEIVHRDLKVENIMLMDDGTLKLVDWGTSKDLLNPETAPVVSNETFGRRQAPDYIGTPQFMSPEAINNKFTDKRSDIYSLGATIYQILVGRPPFCAGSEYLIYTRIQKSDLRFPPGVSKEAKELIFACMNHDASQRPTIEKVKSFKFFEGVDWLNVNPKRNEKRKNPPGFMTLSEMALKKLANHDIDEKWPFDMKYLESNKQNFSEYQLMRLRRIYVTYQWDKRERQGSGPAVAGLADDGVSDVGLPPRVDGESDTDDDEVNWRLANRLYKGSAFLSENKDICEGLKEVAREELAKGGGEEGENID